MSRLVRDTTRPNWIPPCSPEIIKDDEGIPDDALFVMTNVNYGVQPWIFDAYWVPIIEEPELIPNEDRIPWSDDQRLPR